MSEQDFSLALQVKSDNGRMRILVRDTGIGMQPELLDRIHRMLDNQGTSDDAFFISHTGMLNVCRRYMLAYDAKAYIQIASTPQEGTQIVIEIPLPAPSLGQNA